MRTELLCALAFLCGAEIAYGQGWPANNYYYSNGSYYYNNGYYRGAAPGYAYPYGSPAYNPYAAQPRYYYPTAPADTTYANPTPRYSAVASPNQGPSSVQATPVEIAPMPPADYESYSPVPEARPKLVQHPSDGGPPKLNIAEYLASLWPASVPFHRSPCERIWVSGDYLQGWMKPGPLAAPLVTTGLASDTPSAAIGQPGTTVLSGNSLNFRTTPGVRMEIGGFVDDTNRVSLELSGLYYAPTTSRLAVASDAGGNPVIGRPFANTLNALPLLTPQQERAEVDSFPGQYIGGAAVNASSQLWGFEANVRYHIYSLERVHLDFLAGYRFLRLTECLSVDDQVQGIGANTLTLQGAQLPIGTVLTDRDSFNTNNQFSGLNFGGRVRWEGDNYFVSVFGKAAFGCTTQVVQINGITNTNGPNGPQSAQGGVLALSSNIGDYSRNVFAIVPEFGLNFGVDVTPHIRVTAGYSFLYWSQVARPGSQIDHTVNPALIPGDPNFGVAGGGNRPAFAFNETPFWVHSLMCGLEFHY